MNGRACGVCGTWRERSAFSKTQWAKRDGSKCAECTGNPSSCGAGRNESGSRSQGTTQPKEIGACAAPSELGFSARPQMPVPGFDGLTVCSDWPRTKNGLPPNAQSAIFSPLIACSIGPIEHHCSAQEIEAANTWWTNVLPAWPRWVSELQVAGINDHREALIRQAKGQPNALIFKAKGRGSVPHFNGRMQNAMLELAPMVAVEVYACVTVMYSA